MEENTMRGEKLVIINKQLSSFMCTCVCVTTYTHRIQCEWERRENYCTLMNLNVQHWIPRRHRYEGLEGYMNVEISRQIKSLLWLETKNIPSSNLLRLIQHKICENFSIFSSLYEVNVHWIKLRVFPPPRHSRSYNASVGEIRKLSVDTEKNSISRWKRRVNNNYSITSHGNMSIWNILFNFHHRLFMLVGHACYC